MTSTIVGIIGLMFVLLMGFSLSGIASLSIFTGPIVGLALVLLLIVTRTSKLLPLVQGALVLLCGYNPLFVYFVLGTILGSKVLLKVSRTINSQSQVEGLEEGVIGSTMDEINAQWAIHWFWTNAILLGGLITGSLFGLGVITGLGKLLLACSLIAGPFMWVLYICQLEAEERPKFILGGVSSCILFAISLVLLFQGSMLGMLVPFVLLSNGVSSGIKKKTTFKPEQISTTVWGTMPCREVLWYVLASGVFRTIFIFFGGSLLVYILNKEYTAILDDEDKFINHCNSEAIGDALQPIMLWGYLLSRGEMDSFSQLGLSYILSRGEVIVLVLLIVIIQSVFFLMRRDLLTWMINEPTLHVSFTLMNKVFGLDQLLVLGVTLTLGTIILGSCIPVLLMIGLSTVYTMIVEKLKLPSLSQGMSTTFVPIGLYIF